MERHMGVIVFIPPMPTNFPLHPYYAPPLFQQQQQEEETLMIANRTSPENFMGFHVFIPTLHLHPPAPPSAYPPHLLQQNKTRENLPKIFTWKFPESFNLLKLNTDGSSKGNPGPSSFGGLIRDCRGRWLCGYMGKMKGKSFTSLEAEIWSIYKGLCLVKSKNLSNLLIETDCQTALMFRAGEMDQDDPWRPVIEAMERIMIDQKCILIHTRRDGNHCADQLAKFGGNQSEEYSVLEQPPLQLIPYLLRDNQAAYEFQREHAS